MATPAQLRKLALALPETEERSHFDQPDFRVRGKIFAGLDRDGSKGTLKLSGELQAMLLDSRPQAFSAAAGYWGRQGWTHVHLEHVELGALKELVYEAFRMVAPKGLLAAGGAAAAVPVARRTVKKRKAGKTRSRKAGKKRGPSRSPGRVRS